MRASARRETILPPGFASYGSCMLHSDQFFIPSQNLVYMVYLISMPVPGGLGASVHSGKV